MNDSYRVRSPGRVNLIGGHTDYSGGYAMPMATDRQTELTATPATDVTVSSAAMDETCTFDVDDRTSAGDWTDYVRGCYAVLDDAGYDPGGFEGTVEGDLPLGSGLSSSASLELAVLTFLAAAYDLDVSRAELARLGQRVETEFVGVDCGIMDQYAVALSRADHALFLDAETGAYDRVRLPEDLQVLLFHTGTDRELADSAYNERRETVERALAELDADTSKAVDLTDLQQLSDDLARPLGYVVRENTRVRQALGALDEGDPGRLGDVLVESHQDIAANFEASTPELDWVVETAVESGAYGARLTGAGWGGAAVVLAQSRRAASLADELETAYQTEFDVDGTALFVEPSDGVTVTSPTR